MGANQNPWIMRGLGIAMPFFFGIPAIVAEVSRATQPDYPEPARAEKAGRKRRLAAIRRAQEAFGITRTRIARDTVVGTTLAQGATTLGPVESPED